MTKDYEKECKKLRAIIRNLKKKLTDTELQLKWADEALALTRYEDEGN